MGSLSTPFSLDLHLECEWLHPFILFSETFEVSPAPLCVFLPKITTFSSLSFAYLRFHLVELLGLLSAQAAPWCSALFCCCEYFTSPARDYRSHEMKELPIRKWAAFHCTGRVSVSLLDKHDYTLLFCHSNHTSLPAPPSQPLAIYPDMSNQPEQQILSVKKSCHPVHRVYTVCYETVTWNNSVKIWSWRRSYSSLFSFAFLSCQLTFVYFFKDFLRCLASKSLIYKI